MRLQSLFYAKSAAFCLVFSISGQLRAETSSPFQVKDPVVIQAMLAKNKLKDSLPSDSTKPIFWSTPQTAKLAADGNVKMSRINSTPFISVQQMVKGNLAGVYVQEPSGEPGTEQNIFIRGISTPLLSKRELFDNQAAVYLNGIPLAQDNPFAYEIQQYDFNRIGPATNLLAAVNMDNVESIELIKDPVKLAALGPIAANGAIWITTKIAKSGNRQISINSYYGFAAKERITPVNGAYENAFRLPFYDKYGTLNDRFSYPAYLKDSSNADYYGRSNWNDLYYKNAALYNVDMSLTGGSERANFRFFGGATKNANSADETALSRYSASFSINVVPVKWITLSSMINANHMSRDRNKNFRDRLAEVRYIPDISNPLTPGKAVYGQYLSEFDDNVKDDNKTNSVQGYFAILAKLKGIRYDGRLAFDYNEGTRDVFYPTQMLEGNNFVSNYFGYNERFIFKNSFGYDFKYNEKNHFDIELGQSYQNDLNRFDYAYAYNGPNNFIKLNIVNGDPNRADYLQPIGFDVFYHPSRQKTTLASFYGKTVYTYNDIFTFSALVRRDGSSTMQRDNRWYTGFGTSASIDLKKTLFLASPKVSSSDFHVSYGKTGKLLSDDRFANGPNYRADLSWTGAPTIGSYAGLPGLSRPYTSGWVGYGIPWVYTEQITAGIDLGLFAERISLGVDVYSKNDKNIQLPVPVPAEWGYESAYAHGMNVNNMGVDFTLSAEILEEKKSPVSWNFNANLNFNRNKLKALPNGLKELVIGDRKFEVGKRIDAFWVLQNQGIYNTDADVPTNPAGNTPMTYEGVAQKAGDAKWKDVNGDYRIDDNDRQLTGNSLPKLVGGFGSNVGYKSFTLDFQFYFALGQKALNQYASNHLDFINNDNRSDINGVKEITFWEKKMDLSGYPMYNPWSSTIPYRLDQDLFLDNASFLKLRSVTLSYDLLRKNSAKNESKVFRNATVYLTATNLFTITPFKGDDPELVQYNGIYTGTGLPLSRTVIMGIKLDL